MFAVTGNHTFRTNHLFCFQTPKPRERNKIEAYLWECQDGFTPRGKFPFEKFRFLNKLFEQTAGTPTIITLQIPGCTQTCSDQLCHGPLFMSWGNFHTWHHFFLSQCMGVWLMNCISDHGQTISTSHLNYNRSILMLAATVVATWIRQSVRRQGRTFQCASECHIRSL